MGLPEVDVCRLASFALASGRRAAALACLVGEPGEFVQLGGPSFDLGRATAIGLRDYP